MKITRSPRPDRGFTQIDNRVLRDHRVSYRARGLLAELLSYPDGWEIDLTRLSQRSGRVEGREALRAAMRELEAAGYVARTRRQDPKTGWWSTRTEVYDVPAAGWPDEPPPRGDRPDGTEDGFSGVGATSANGEKPQVAPKTGNPSVGSPDVGAPGAKKKTVTKDCQEELPPPPTPSDQDLGGGGGKDPSGERGGSAARPAPTPAATPLEAPTTPAGAPPTPKPQADALDVLTAIGDAWRRPPVALAPLAPAVAAALGTGWQPDALARHLAADPPDEIRKPTALLARRLADLPARPEDCDCRACTPAPPATCLAHRIDIRAGETCPYCEISGDQPPRPALTTCAKHQISLTANGTCRSCRADQLAGSA